MRLLTDEEALAVMQGHSLPTPGVDVTPEGALAADDLFIMRFRVPEWGGFGYVRTLRSRERDEFETFRVESREANPEAHKRQSRAWFVIWCACKRDGSAMFTDSQVFALCEKSGSAMDRYFDAAGKLNRFFSDDVEVLAKNSASGPSDSSGTTSPEPSAAP